MHVLSRLVPKTKTALYRALHQSAVRKSHGPWRPGNRWGETASDMKHEITDSLKGLQMNKIYLAVLIPLLFLSAYLTYKDVQQEFEHLKHRKRGEEGYIEYAYLGNRYKPFPWGDGNKSLLHNPYVNWVPGVGYERYWSEELEDEEH